MGHLVGLCGELHSSQTDLIVDVGMVHFSVHNRMFGSIASIIVASSSLLRLLCFSSSH